MAKSQLSTSTELLQLISDISALTDVDAIIDKVLSRLQELYSLKTILSAEAEGELALPLKLRDTTCAYICLGCEVPSRGKRMGIATATSSPRNDKASAARARNDRAELELFMQLVSQRIDQLQLTMDLSASNERLLEQSKYMSQIFSTVSHELRTPLTNVIGFSELMLARELDAKTQQQYLSEVARSARRLSTLINDFLDLSRVEANGCIRLDEREPADIDWIAERAWKDLNSELILSHKPAEIEWQIAKGLPKLLVDSDAMVRVFINLFSNALKYGAGSRISCQIAVTKDLVQVKVEDRGIGIPQDMLTAVFDRFVRVDNGVTRETGGTGLGLWICQQIIEAHGGKIWAESKVNQGTSVYFNLPYIK